jgi:hypothetical protein
MRTDTPTDAYAILDSPPNSVSTLTQLASLRGALEAARTREEKSRLDAERLGKECEMLKWKWGEDWRSREAEVRTSFLSQLSVF